MSVASISVNDISTLFFFFQAEDGIRDYKVTGVQTCALPICDLITVHDRAGQLVREFEWDHHRISAHRHASGPWHRYRYESAQPGARVIEHSNQEGLSYRFDYLAQPPGPDGQPRAATDRKSTRLNSSHLVI